MSGDFEGPDCSFAQQTAIRCLLSAGPGKTFRASRAPNRRLMGLGSTCRIIMRGHLGVQPSPWHPTSARMLASIRPFFSHFSFRHRVGVEQKERVPKGHIFPVALFNISLAEFPPVTSRMQARCKNQEQTLTRWPCFTQAKFLRGFKWWGALSREPEEALSPHGRSR